MKTLLFTLEYPPFKGGVAKYYEKVRENWPDKDNFFVLADRENGEAAPGEERTTREKLVGKIVRPRWIWSLGALYRIIKKEKVEHILVGHLLPLGLAAYYVSKIVKIKYSVILHSMDLAYAQKTRRKKRLARKVLANAKAVICNSNYGARMAGEFMGGNEKIFVVNPGMDADIPVDKDRLAKLKQEIFSKYDLADKIVLFSVGRLVKRKGFDKTIEAMPEILKYKPNLYYFIMGDGPDKAYLKNFARGVKNIFFLGKKSDEEKWAWLSLCDIFIMPSRDIAGDVEGFGIVYLEAGAAGKPIIAGESGGTEDAVRSGLNGILVDPENTEKIANAVIKLAGDENLRKELGEQGRARVLKDFNPKDKAVEIYEIILNSINL